MMPSTLLNKISTHSTATQSLPLQPLPTQPKCFFFWPFKKEFSALLNFVYRWIVISKPYQVFFFSYYQDTFNLSSKFPPPNSFCVGQKTSLCGPLIFGFCIKPLKHQILKKKETKGLQKLSNTHFKPLKMQSRCHKWMSMPTLNLHCFCFWVL